jgi:Cu(I)/Ag(I) efflux system membrane fusion protein
MVEHATHVAGATSLDTAREGFRGLTDAMLELTRSFGNPMDEEVRVAFCPMAGDNAGAPWLQRGEAVDNPYFGEAMLTCGEVRNVLDKKGHMPADLSRDIPRRAPAAEHVH